MTNILRAHDIVKRYGGKEVNKNISVKVAQGSIVALLGPNGSGKTTFFKILSGLLKSDEGYVKFNDVNISSLNLYERSRLGLAYLPQESSIFRGMTVQENLLAILEIYYSSKTVVMQQLDLLLEQFRLCKIKNNKAVAISGGQKRRLEIARALINNPRCVLLDEPFAGIDPVAISDIIEMIMDMKKKGIAVLITDHNVRETLKVIDYGYIIHDGIILMQGKPQDIISHGKTREVYLGNNFVL